MFDNSSGSVCSIEDDIDCEKPKLERSHHQVSDSDHVILSSFLIGPLASGFGLTLGNSLRRVLLSSVPGLAVVSIKFNDALHEFTSVAGVMEDMTDVIFNVKGIIFKSSLDKTSGYKATLSAKGPCVVKAGDLELPGGLEVLNKDHVICNVTGNIPVTMEINVQKGIGYFQPKIADKDEEEVKIYGLINIDAFFSPVERVTYAVEPIRVGGIAKDRLRLTIETNGSILPSEALSVSSKLLIEQFSLFVEKDNTICDKQTAAAEDLSSSGPVSQINPNCFKRIIDIEDLSRRAVNCLMAENIVYIGDLIHKTENDLLRTPNFGRKSLNLITKVLSDMGLSLGTKIPNWPPENIVELVKKFNKTSNFE